MLHSLKNAKEYVDKYKAKAKNINEKCFERISINKKDKRSIPQISYVNFPIFYLFDNSINSNISSDAIIRTFLRNDLNLDKLFGLTTDNLINVTLDAHSTMFYKFNIKDRKYLYYSNSGLGINNQLTYNDVTSCKILCISDMDIYECIPDYIIIILSQIKNFRSLSRFPEFNTSQVGKIWRKLENDPIIKKIGLSLDEYSVLTDFVIYDNKKDFPLEEDEYKMQTLCCALLNYIIYKLNKNESTKYINNFECSFNHLLFGTDNDKYKENINQLSNINGTNDAEVLIKIINNCYTNYNKNIYKEILKIPELPKIEFQEFVNTVNDKLRKIDNPTIKYKLENSFNLSFSNIHGLCNNIQNAGSCVFYSYYNLALNMKLLETYNNKKIDEFINAFIEFHYLMIFLLCITNDTQFTPNKISIYDENNLYNSLYIDRLINENNLLEEILEVYTPNDTLVFNPNKMLIDYSLNRKVAGTLKKFETVKKLNNNIITPNIFKCIDDIIYEIRTNKGITAESIKDTINTLYEPILLICNDDTKGDNIFTFYKESSTNYKSNILLFFNIIKNIQIIYLIILLNLYNNPNSKFRIGQKDENIIEFNLLNFCQPINENPLDLTCIGSFSKKNKCKKIDGEFAYYELSYNNNNNVLDDFILSRLNSNEIVNISDILSKEDINFIEMVNPNNYLNLEYCKYIYVHKFILCLSNYYEPTNISFGVTNNNMKNSDDLENYMKVIFNKFIKSKYKINDKNIQDYITLDYKNIIENIQNNILDIMINIIENGYPTQKSFDNWEINVPILTMFILIITDCKYLLISKEINISHSSSLTTSIYDILNYYLIINQDTIIYSGNFLFNREEYLFKLLPLLKEIQSDKSKIEKNIESIIEYISLSNDKINWIKDINFELPKDNTYKHKIDQIEYFAIDFLNSGREFLIGETFAEIKDDDELYKDYIKYRDEEDDEDDDEEDDEEDDDEEDDEEDDDEEDDFNEEKYKERKKQREQNLEYLDNVENGFQIILSRFGINLTDSGRYLILFPKNCINILSIEKYKIYDIKKTFDLMHNKCFILILEYKKCIEIGFDNNGKIVNDKCYIFDKDNRNHLLLNLDKQLCPFLSIIPSGSPYLCYKMKNEYYLQFILSPKNKDFLDALYNNREIKLSYKMFSLKISPSMLFPIIDTFNLYNYNKLYELYDTNHINKINTQFLKSNIIMDKDILNKYNLSDKIKRIKSKLNSHVTYDTSKIEPFLEIMNNEINNDLTKKEIFNSFISENRLCTFKCPLNCEYYTDQILILHGIKNNILKSLKLDKIKNNANNNITDYILKNFNEFLILMEINILINALSIVNKKTNCWDIGYVLTTIKSIIYFNKTITQKFYYGFELLFLLQNDYFFKENQMKKYDEIRQDLINNNPELKLHQFMMGKGKTSVFTPLLSFAVNLLSNSKIPTIITVEHLVEQTKKYMNFTERITDLKTNIFSDFEAKKRWLIHSDLKLKDDNDEEIRINIEELSNLSININKEIDADNLKKKQIMHKEFINDIKNKISLDIKNEINIIDEFDYHHNYLQSMFNYVQKKQNISEELYNYIFDFTYNKLNDPTYSGDSTKIIKNSIDGTNINMIILNKNLSTSFNQTNAMNNNEDYGLSFLVSKNEKNTFWRICTPFARKDTPIKDSNFSSLLLKLILTIKLYIQTYKSELQDFDYENICKNKIIITELLPIIKNAIDEKEIIIFYKRCNLNILNNIGKLFKKIYDNSSQIQKINILKKYLYTVNKSKINITSEQRNMSFQDIIYNNYEQWQVGYTGTTSLKLNDYIDNEKFVFKKIKEDFDEKVEVTLALYKYGSNNSKKDIRFIKKNNDWKDSINQIMMLLGKDARGFVDLAGIFVDLKNEDIAKELKRKYKNNKKIVYITIEGEGMEYNSNDLPTKYIPSDENNFYYYDQCHTVGTDLKQPRIGHVCITINSRTRWTDFAQAIFRFRKLNRGTYLSIIYIYEEKLERGLYDSIKKIYNLLKTNDDKFNDEQCNGTKYQLLKAMVRKKSKSYYEDRIYPEFLRNEAFNNTNIQNYMIENIHNISEDLNKENGISTIYNELISAKDKIISVVIGSENTIEQEQEEQKEKDKQKNKQKEKEIIKDNVYSKLGIFKNKLITVFKHLNCTFCNIYNCIKLFKTSDILINDKEIYISYNFLELDLGKDYYKEEEIGIKFYNNFTLDKFKEFLKYKTGRFCYIEFNDKILIEREDIALDFYLFKLPVYDYFGNILIPYMVNECNKNEDYPLKESILDIDYQFIKLLGIKNYINPIIKTIIDVPIKDIIEKINPIGFIVLSYLYLSRVTDRYNIDAELINKINDIDMIDQSKLVIEIPKLPMVHVNNSNTFLTIYYNQYKNILKLENDGYKNIIPNNDLSIIFYIYKYKFNYDTTINNEDNDKIRGFNIKKN
jgi:hypothetical protein